MKILICIAALFGFYGVAGADSKLTIAGAGPSTQIVQLFMTEFSNSPMGKGIKFDVPTLSVKHAGGIKSSDKNLVGRTGRPLNDKEKKLGKTDIFLGEVPVGIVVGKKVGLKKLTLKQYQGIISGKIKNWSEVGGSKNAIVLVGREPTEALFTQMKAKYSFYSNAKFQKILKKDHQVKNFLESEKGLYGMGFGSKSYFPKENLIDVKDYFVGGKIGLVYDKKNTKDPILKRIIGFAKSAKWRSVVEKNGYFSIKADAVN